MRCLALAQAWQDGGGEVACAMAESTLAICDRLSSEGVEIVSLKAGAGSSEDAAEVAKVAHEHQANWVVVDGYEFDAEYQRRLKDSGLKVFFVDDNGHAAHYCSDIVLNQNVHATEDLYPSRGSYSRLLLGPRYAMLRREFHPWRDWKRKIAPAGRKVLVTMGGSDPDNVTGRVVDALRFVTLEKLEVTVLVGGSNPYLESLERAVEHPGAVRFVKNPSNIPELMAWADVAVSAAGTTCLEMCFLGLPALLIDVAANQTPVAEVLDQRNIAIHLGGADQVSAETIARELKSILSSEHARVEMSRRSRELVDGDGAERVVHAMQSANLHLRRVEERDCTLLWEWANDPVVRAASFSWKPIPFEQHQKWFAAKMKDRTCLMFIGENGDEGPVGQFRIECRGSREGEIDVSLAANLRGSGYGSTLINLGVREVFATTPIERVHAIVRARNQASIRAFEAAGFVRMCTERVQGHLVFHYLRTRDQKKGYRASAHVVTGNTV
jgi:UDP-2,4-diacetamido-2,4,6-trideoxy-beta-L-altropyranose hydrolase